MKNDSLGDAQKNYERVGGCEDRLLPIVPAIARLDGKCFHSFTRFMDRPYDKRLSDLMVQTTFHLTESYNALIGYTQSDEITLVWEAGADCKDVPFAGRIQKINSVLAADCAVFFNERKQDFFPGRVFDSPALFDCRAFSVPTREEACRNLMWREMDATRNSVLMAARSMFSHKQLHKVGVKDMKQMMLEAGMDWKDYPAFFKRGTYVQRRRELRKFSVEEIDALPPKHEARVNPDLKVLRSEFVRVDMPPWRWVMNRENVVFEGAEPIKED